MRPKRDSNETLSGVTGEQKPDPREHGGDAPPRRGRPGVFPFGGPADALTLPASPVGQSRTTAEDEAPRVWRELN